jgi:hypothetical protein
MGRTPNFTSSPGYSSMEISPLFHRKPSGSAQNKLSAIGKNIIASPASSPPIASPKKSQMGPRMPVLSE